MTCKIYLPKRFSNHLSLQSHPSKDQKESLRGSLNQTVCTLRFFYQVTLEKAEIPLNSVVVPDGSELLVQPAIHRRYDLRVCSVAAAVCFLVSLVVVEVTATKRRNTVDSASHLLIHVT
jgi:hypothetical protein